MIILAVETSCDDTCVAIAKEKSQGKSCLKILSNIVSSQVEIHKKWGGIYPSLAKREHQKNLPVVLKKALNKAGSPKIDLIAVTVGPGLEPCLWVGVNFAKELAKKMKSPIIPVNHIEAHILANWLSSVGENPKSKIPNPNNIFPAVCLVVSGGHTQLILMKDFGKYKIIGETRDDAAGECFDKTARILGLGYPGGPIVAKMATKFKIQNSKFKINLPRPMIYQKNYDFSFSGLKTAVLYNYKNQPERSRKSKKYIREMSLEIQQAIIDVLISKTLKAAKEFKAKSIILGGGVAANEELRNQLQAACLKDNFRFLTPKPKLCTDNAAMVAVTAYYSRLKGRTKTKMKIEADANLSL